MDTKVINKMLANENLGAEGVVIECISSQKKGGDNTAAQLTLNGKKEKVGTTTQPPYVSKVNSKKTSITASDK